MFSFLDLYHHSVIFYLNILFDAVTVIQGAVNEVDSLPTYFLVIYAFMHARFTIFVYTFLIFKWKAARQV